MANQVSTQNHHSDILENFLSLGTPEESQRVQNKMMMASKIADAIKNKRISKKEFAELINQKPSVITKWLSGGHNFTMDTLSDIQAAARAGVRSIGVLTALPEGEYREVRRRTLAEAGCMTILDSILELPGVL